MSVERDTPRGPTSEQLRRRVLAHEHGAAKRVDLAAWLGDDPALGLVTADARAWDAAHPCDCEALCTCGA